MDEIKSAATNVSGNYGDIPFFPESSYKSASVTGKKGMSPKSEHGSEDKFPFPFCCLKAEKSNGSSGKRWIFFNDKRGIFVGYLFPGGYRLINNIKQTDSLGEFF